MASAKEVLNQKEVQGGLSAYYPRITIRSGSEAYELLKNIEVGTMLDLFVRAKMCFKSESADGESDHLELEVQSVDVAMSYDKDFGESY